MLIKKLAFLNLKNMQTIRDLYLKNSTNGPVAFSFYEFDLCKEHAIQLAEKLGCQRDNSVSIPEELPSFSLVDNRIEAIMVETGFGVSFEPSQQKIVDQALTELGYSLYNISELSKIYSKQ